VLAADRQLLVAGRGGDHARAERLANFNGRQPHPARSTEHQHRFAAFKGCPVHDRVVRRAVGEGDGGRRVEVHTRGHMHQGLDRDHDLLRERAGGGEGDDLVASLEAFHPVAHGAHHA
jgi:hypothetical protein